jgi:hypothetical protein
MRYIYNYVYYQIYQLISKWKRYNARESAILYLSAILCFITIPVILGAVSKFIGVPPKWLFFLTGGICCLLIYWFNKRYFERNNRIKEIHQQFKNQTGFQNKIGLVIIILLIISAPLLFFLILTLF